MELLLICDILGELAGGRTLRLSLRHLAQDTLDSSLSQVRYYAEARQ